VAACAPGAAPSPGAATASASAAGDDACTDVSSVDVLHHDVALRIGVSPAAIAGTEQLRVRTKRATSHVALDARGLDITRVDEGGRPLPFAAAGGRLCVTLPAARPAQTELTLHLAWTGTATKTPHFAADQVWAGYDAAAWMPTLLDPAQRATLALTIAAPAGLRVVTANGRARPAPPFLYAFAVGPFEEATLDVDGTTLRAYGPKGADLAGALAITAPMLRFLVAHTGARFPAEEYAQVFVTGDAAQEAAGLSLIDATALDDVRADPKEDWIFAHELAHQWFAWLVPCADFSDFWLNEGFATFFTAAIKEARWGREAYDRELGLWRERSAKVHAQGKDAPLSLSDPRAPPRPPPRESELQPRGVTYSRGALVLAELRRDLGEAAFWDGIRRYVRSTAGRGARSEDLRVALEASSGQDLRAYFARRVYAPSFDL
jgi:aminopeptidase N